MLRRTLIVTLLLAAPLVARADDTPTSASTDLSQPGGGAAAALGPTTGGDSGGSNADATSLQPAGGSPLQSTTNDSTGLTAPGSNTLQAPTGGNSNGTLQVLLNDADGPTHQPTDSGGSNWDWLWLSLLIGLVVAAGAVALRHWQRLRKLHPRYADAPQDPLAESSAELPSEAPTPQSEPTSSQRLSLIIDLPPAKVFKFLTNPENTPLWVEAIAKAETSEWPAKLGTVYTNQDADGNSAEYEVTEFEKNQLFTLSKKSNGYHVKYTLTPHDKAATEVEYYEWMDEGFLSEPFTGAEFEKFKTALEAPH